MFKSIVVILLTSVVMIWAVYWAFTNTKAFNSRDYKNDQLRYQDLTEIMYQVQTYYSDHRSLPQSLNDLSGQKFLTGRDITDPVTKKVYEYSKLEAPKYQVCINYAQDDSTSDTGEVYKTTPPLPSGAEDSIYTHKKGRNCYTLNADPYGYDKPLPLYSSPSASPTY